jgi:hypothetical protein
LANRGYFGERFRNIAILNALELLVSYLLEHGVKAVFYAVFCPTWKLFHDLGPAVADLRSKHKNFELFIDCKRVSVNLRVEIIVPPFSALLAVSRDA